jgi:hypothetical protein
MGIYAFFTMACWLAIAPCSGKIINGYEKDIESARASAQHLRKLPRQRSVLVRLEKVEEFILYHALTNTLLDRFQKISPSLFSRVDSIVDQKGRRVDVYIKFIPRNRRIDGTIASTGIGQMHDDEHSTVSGYGPHTVSIHVSVVKHSLIILAHEFGHVSYQVPNLASYFTFFRKGYPDRYIQAEYLGHKPNDPSGQKAVRFEKQFRKEAFLFSQRTRSKRVDPFAIRNDLAKLVIQKK